MLTGLLLAGCGHAGLGSPQGLAPAPTEVRVDSAFAETLNSKASVGTYKAVDGSYVTLSLGAPYVSARGLTCRIGRRDGDRHAYGFCRDGADWYAVPPAMVAGN